MSDTNSMRNKASSVKRLRDVHAEATRAALVGAALKRFVAQGYAGTSLDDIATDVGSSKGAIYHHFKDKQALFGAVYELLSQELIESIASAIALPSASVEAALRAFVVHAGEARYVRVLFLDGPSALGSQACRAIDMRHSLGLITQLIHLHAPAALIEETGLDILARLLLSTLVEAAQIVAVSQDTAATSERVLSVMGRVVHGLLQGDSAKP